MPSPHLFLSVVEHVALEHGPNLAAWTGSKGRDGSTASRGWEHGIKGMGAWHGADRWPHLSQKGHRSRGPIGEKTLRTVPQGSGFGGQYCRAHLGRRMGMGGGTRGGVAGDTELLLGGGAVIRYAEPSQA